MSGYKIAVYSPSRDQVVEDENTTVTSFLIEVAERTTALKEKLLAEQGEPNDWVDQLEWQED